jgi:hypothetical protein
VVSTLTSSTNLLTASTVSTATSMTTTTSITTVTSSVAGGGIPGFPLESILAGLVFGLATLSVLRRRRRSARG